MQRMILVATVAATVAGFVSAFGLSQLFGQAGAAPPAQARESVLSVIAGKFVEVVGPSTGTWVDIMDSDAVLRLGLDASKYPAGTSFRLEVAGSHGLSDPVGTGCIRLAEVAGQNRIPVAGSDVCSSDGGPFFTSGSAFALPTGSHVYTLQVQSTPQGGVLRRSAARVIADWMERAR